MTYEAGLRRRSHLTFWLEKTALTKCRPRRRMIRGVSIYAEMAIELLLTLRLVFNPTLRQVEVSRLQHCVWLDWISA